MTRILIGRSISLFTQNRFLSEPFLIFSSIKPGISCLIANLVLLVNCSIAIADSNQISPISAEDLAVIVNIQDPQSRAVAEYYTEKRKIPAENVIHVNFYADKTNMDIQTFSQIKAVIDNSTLDRIKAYAITWTEPYRVDCLSMTSAITFGFDTRYCALGCQATKVSPFYRDANWQESKASMLRSAKQLRPAMVLAGRDIDEVRELIDRGVQADHSFPEGRGYFLTTSDKKRSVRRIQFNTAQQMKVPNIALHHVKSNFLLAKFDLMFYFTGKKSVSYLGANRFLPGAIADHLTSAGGNLTDSYQMSILRWLEAGATASYGTVVEPCNFLEKFPDVRILLKYYSQGSSLIEAYWRSVMMPGQGIFVGEPLAAPFANR